MKKYLLSVLVFAFLVACGDEGSSNPVVAENSSSSEQEDLSTVSSSSVASSQSESASCSSIQESSSQSKEASSSSDAQSPVSSFVQESDEKSSSSVLSSSSEVVESSSSLDKTSSSSRSNETIHKDTRDGRVYRVVLIGEMVWMAENLNYETQNSYCAYSSPDSCAKYGRLYTWADAVGKTEEDCGAGHDCGMKKNDYAPGICPMGSHIPTQKEWYALMEAIGGQNLSAVMKLKATAGWADDANGSDDYGYSVYPEGMWFGDTDVFHKGEMAAFWASTEYSADMANSVKIYKNDIMAGPENKSFGMNVRCVLD